MPETNAEIETPEVIEEPQQEPAPVEDEEPEDLGDAGKSALHKEREARRKAESAHKKAEAKVAEAQKKLDDLAAKVKAFEDEKKTDGQKKDERIEELQQQLNARIAELAETQSASLKNEVAAAKGVPASRLVGETREELEASADELIAWRDANAPKRKPPTTAPGLKSGASAPGDHPSDAKERAAAALRNYRRGGV
jgi:hypothetical protein